MSYYIMMLVIGILILIVLIIGYVYYQKKSAYDEASAKLALETDALVKMTARANALSAEVSLKDATIQQISDELKVNVTNVRNLTDQLKTSDNNLAQKSTELANARKAMFEADDYIFAHYLGNKKHIDMLRRIRDVLLLGISNYRKFMCSEFTKRLQPVIDFYSTGIIQNPAVRPNPMDYQRSNCTPPSDVTGSTWQTCLDSDRWNAANQTYSNYSNYNNYQSVCTDRINMLNNAFSQYKNTSDFQMTHMWPGLTKEIVLELVDAIEAITFLIADSTCLNFSPEKVKQLYVEFLNILCKDDPLINGIISKPIDLILVKTFNMFNVQ